MQNKSTFILALVVITIAVVTLIGGWSMVINHLQEASWSEHSKFHAILGGLDRIALAILIPFVAWTTFTGRGHLGRITISLALVLAPASFLISAAARPQGAPERLALAIAAGVVIAGVAAVWTMWPMPANNGSQR